MITLNGLCVSNGIISGNAYVIKSKKNVKECFIPNTILVLRSLDRDLLINLNSNIVGVIAERGNIGSHGAGILRQLKIPCVLRVKYATVVIKNGDYVEINGDQNSITSYGKKEYEMPKQKLVYGLKYKSISKDQFEIDDIRLQKKWISIRPTRCYQKLRFEMFKDVHSQGPNMMFGLPLTEVKQDEKGVMIEYGAPYISDICSYVLLNPNWLTYKCLDRAKDINKIKRELYRIKSLVTRSDFNSVVEVFSVGIQLYRVLFKYMYMTQVISEEMLDIYVDFISYLFDEKTSKELLGLESDYVKRSLESGIYPGNSQIWSSQRSTPYIWEGEIDYKELSVNTKIVNLINSKRDERDKLMRDYSSFRLIIPLLYQLSEEYYYVSSSIHSFVSWSLVKIAEQLKRIYPNIQTEDLYNKSLNDVWELINQIKN